MNSRHADDGEGSHVTEPVDDSRTSAHVTAGFDVTSIGELSEVVGKLVAVDRNGLAVIEATRRFAIPMGGAPSSLRGAVGKVVGVMVIGGQVRWRLMEVAPESGKGGRP